MNVQMVTSSEPSIAMLAHERFLACVLAVMSCQLVRARELPRAILPIAFVRLLARVRAIMLLQVRAFQVGLGTTGIRALEVSHSASRRRILCARCKTGCHLALICSIRCCQAQVTLFALDGHLSCGLGLGVEHVQVDGHTMRLEHSPGLLFESNGRSGLIGHGCQTRAERFDFGHLSCCVVRMWLRFVHLVQIVQMAFHYALFLVLASRRRRRWRQHRWQCGIGEAGILEKRVMLVERRRAWCR